MSADRTRTVMTIEDVRPSRLRPSGGSFVGLSCGHERWLAGVRSQDVTRLMTCTMSPCYQGDRYMGD